MKLNWKFLFVPALAMHGHWMCRRRKQRTAISRPAAEQDSRELLENTKSCADGNYDRQAQVPRRRLDPTTTVSFSEYEFDFGTLAQGDAVTHLFEFTNSGDEPLIIDNCKGSCGCTVPKCPKNPIQPGEKGQIEVKFNSKGKKNQQTKKVTINANTDPAQTFLTIKAFVEAEPGT